MPSNITDVSTFTSPVTTVSDGDAASAANFAVAIQGLANRTRYLKDSFIGVATVVAMAAREAATGDIVLVNDPTGDGPQGFYVFLAGDATATSLPWVKLGTNVTTPGAWFHELYAIKGATSGIALIDSSGFAAQYPHYGQRNDVYVASVGAFSTTSTVIVAVTGTTTSDFGGSGTVVGDHVDIDVKVLVDAITAGAESAFVYVQYEENGGAWTTITESGIVVTGIKQYLTMGGIRRTVGTAGTFKLRLAGNSLTGVSVSITCQALRARIVRP